MLDRVIAVLSPVIVYCIITILHTLVPARWVSGYVTKQDQPGVKLKYRLNGVPVLAIVIAGWCALCSQDLLAWDYFYQTRVEGTLGAVVFGLIFSFLIVMPYKPVRSSLLADYFFGRAENPQWRNGHVDAKMLLYLIGAVMLALNALSFSAFHYQKYSSISSFSPSMNPGVFLSTGLLMFFLIEYLFFEEVHLYTYDFFAERVGFKLGWGCIAFYPYFYAIPMWTTVDLPAGSLRWDSSFISFVIPVVVFFFGWSCSRGANMQKFTFKQDPKRHFLGIAPKVVSDEKGKRKLLISGWWGLSRHINYLGEILMATGIVLALGHPTTVFWPWLYPLYYVALLFPRQADDDARCAKKYGKLWDQYVEKVPYRIIPLIY